MKSISITAAVLAAALGMAAMPARAGHWYPAETFSDACTGDVVIKSPWSNTTPFTNANSDKGDVILARSQAMCGLIGANGTQGVCGLGKWTEMVRYADVKNSDDRFRWFCGMTKERSRCTSGTGRVRWKLGVKPLFYTQCLKWDPT